MDILTVITIIHTVVIIAAVDITLHHITDLPRLPLDLTIQTECDANRVVLHRRLIIT